MSDYEILIDVNELRKRLGERNWRIVDCRFNLLEPQQGFAQYRAGHIPTAYYADLDKDLAAPVTPTSGRHPLPDARKFAARLGQLGISNDTQVVVYDEAGGAIAARLNNIKNSLKYYLTGHVEVESSGFDGKSAEYNVTASTTGQQMASELESKKFDEFNIKILNSSLHTLSIALVRQ